MSDSFSCKCPERKKPIQKRRWTIWQYHCNYSAFSGYHYTPSDYSQIHCLACGATGRTKAKYVEELELDLNYTMYDDGPLYNLDGSPQTNYDQDRGVSGLIASDTVSS